MKISVQLKVLSLISFVAMALMLISIFSIWRYSQWNEQSQNTINSIQSTLQQILSVAFINTRYQDDMDDHLESYINTLRNQLTKIPKLDTKITAIITIIHRRSDSIQSRYDNLKKLSTEHANNPSKKNALSYLGDGLYSQLILLQEDINQLDSYLKDNLNKRLSDNLLYLLVFIFILSALPIMVNLNISHHLSKRLAHLLNVTHNIQRGNFSARSKLDRADELGEISQAIDKALDSIEKLTISRDELENIVKERTHQLEELATKDGLTGVLNRRSLMDRTSIEITRSRRHKNPLSLIFMDLDHFKTINDQYGHSIGDQTLIEVCRLLETILRESDLLARYGGEEFSILCIETDLIHAYKLGERIRDSVETFFRNHIDLKNGLTVSIGITELHPDDDINLFFKRADQALYCAKDTGRNKVETS